MGHRLSTIYTRTGDKGMTGLGNGSRTSKDTARVEAFGTLDELNSCIGMVLSYAEINNLIKDTLTEIQHRLFDLGGELCIPGHQTLTEAHTAQLEMVLDSLNKDLPALKEFILPAGHPAAAMCHIARTVCRRAERRVVTLSAQEPINPHALTYLNRLSDLLFVIARHINKLTGHKEPLWQHQRKKHKKVI